MSEWGDRWVAGTVTIWSRELGVGYLACEGRRVGFSLDALGGRTDVVAGANVHARINEDNVATVVRFKREESHDDWVPGEVVAWFPDLQMGFLSVNGLRIGFHADALGRHVDVHVGDPVHALINSDNCATQIRFDDPMRRNRP